MLNKCILKLNFLLTFLLLSTLGQAQEINWVVKPTIKNADDIVIPQKFHTDKTKLIMIKKGGKFGIVDSNGDIIIPVENDRVQVWNSGKHCSSFTNKIQKFYDNEGYEIEDKEVTEINRKRQRKEKEEKMNVIIEEFKSKNSMIDFLKEDRRYTIINSETGDTIVAQYSDKTKLIKDDLLSSYADGGKAIFDMDGNILQKFGTYADIMFEEETYFVVRDKKKYGLFDSNFKAILPLEYDRLKVLGEEKLMLEKDEKCFIADLSGKPIYDVRADFIQQSEDKKILVGKDKRRTYLYNSATNSFKTYEFGISGFRKNQTKVRATNPDTLSGLFDLTTGEMIVPMEYRYGTVAGDLFIGSNTKGRGKRKINISRRTTLKDVYNSEGTKILSDTIGTIQKITEDYYKVNLVDSKIIMDANGKTIKEYDNATVMNFSTEGFIGTKERGEKVINYYTSANFFAGNFDQSFNSLKKVKTYSKTEKDFYIAKKKDKYGVIDIDGNILVPFELDSIDTSSNKNFLKVKKDGAFGIIKNPVKK